MVFDVYEVDCGINTEVSVHWSQAFALFDAKRGYSVTRVEFTDGTRTYASGRYCNTTGRLVRVFTLGGSLVLERTGWQEEAKSYPHRYGVNVTPGQRAEQEAWFELHKQVPCGSPAGLRHREAVLAARPA